MPSVSIYRPPAARRLEQNANLSNLHSPSHRHQGRNEENGNTDPEKSKTKCFEESKDNISSNISPRIHENGISVFRNAISSIRTQNKVPSGCKTNADSTVSANKKCDSVSPIVTKIDDSCKSKPRRPDIQVYVPKGRRNVPQQPVTSIQNESSNANKTNSANYFNSNICDNKANVGAIVKENKSEEESSVSKKKIIDELVDDSNEKLTDKVADEIVEEEAEEKLTETKEVTRDEVTEKITFDEVSASLDCKPSEVPEDDEPISLLVPSQGSKESPETKENGVSCPDSTEAASDKIKKVNGEGSPVESKKDNQKPKEIHLNPDECDWESMFDDTGECLDPSLLEQLTTAVGDVTIETPKTGYDSFKTKSLDVISDEFPHVIEIYNFPPEFQLQDLMTVFSQFKNSGFEIKWVDDTHALGIFSSSAVVSEVLSFYHPFVKTRSLKEGTPLSKMKARRSAEFLLPYKPRPDTCPALARRLVTGALGVKLKTSREEREAEKKILTQAREKKKLEARQKEDAWEGTFS